MWIIIFFEVISSILITIFTVDPINYPTVLACLGRREVFYSFDYFKIGGRHRGHVICNFDHNYAKWACYISQFIKKFISSNLIDIFFMIKIVRAMKSQTDSIVDLVTPKILMKRKRFVLIFKPVQCISAQNTIIYIIIS